MTNDRPPSDLSRRERQIMDILHRRGQATAAEIQEDMPDAPSYSAVRAHLRTLGEKGLIRYQATDLRYVYRPVEEPEKARRHALRHLVDTFFGGSPARAVAALLDGDSAQLSADELNRLQQLIEQAKREGL
jgi:BlaI family penicillinase repressor